jgi:hypothetical protein
LTTEDWRRPRVFGPAVVYLVLALAWSWPLPLHVADRFTHDPGDPLLNTYLIWWNAQAVPLTAAYWNAPFYWPMHGMLGIADHLAGLSPITTPLQLLGASPLLAYNILLLASTWWTGLATHALTKRLGASTPAAYVAGIAFAYAPYRASQLSHIQIYACWWIPLSLLALHAYYEDGRARWLFLLGASWLLQGLTNGYFLLFMPVLTGFWLLWFTRPAQIAAAWRAAAALGVAAILALPFLVKYYAVQSALGLSRSVGEMAAYSARPEAFLSATPVLRFWQTRPPPTTEHYLFPGVTALALAVAGVFVATRDRRYLFYVLAAILMTVLSTGPAQPLFSIEALWHPYTLLAWLPGYRGLRVPARFFMLAVLCLAVAAGLSFAAIERRFPRRRALLAAIAFAGLVVDGAIAGMPLGAPPPQLRVPESGARVLALPFEDGQVSVNAMYQSMTHHRPVVNGYAGYSPPHAGVIEWALGRQDSAILTELRRGHPLYVLVASTDHAPFWTAFMDKQPDTVMLGIEGGGRLYRMAPAPYAQEVRAGAAIGDAIVRAEADWLVADVLQARALRGIELRVYGKIWRLPKELRIETSADGAHWQPAFEGGPAGLALVGALDRPAVLPLRVDLRDVVARYVRVNAPVLGVGGMIIYAP